MIRFSLVSRQVAATAVGAAAIGALLLLSQSGRHATALSQLAGTTTPLATTSAQTPMPAPPGMTAVTVPNDTNSPLLVNRGEEFVLLPGDDQASVVASDVALKTAQDNLAFFGPGPITWSGPTRARLITVGPNGTVIGEPSGLDLVFVASQVYAGYPYGMSWPHGVTPPPMPLRHHYVVVMISALTGQEDALWAAYGPPV